MSVSSEIKESLAQSTVQKVTVCPMIVMCMLTGNRRVTLVWKTRIG